LVLRRVVGVFVRFSCAASAEIDQIDSPALLLLT
jgi:hypothetical protein